MLYAPNGAQLTGHPAVFVVSDPEASPAELCGTCSDAEGELVPVTRCRVAAANQLPEGAPRPDVITLLKKCPQCGRREQMEPWRDNHGSGWQCSAMDCLYFGVDGEDE